MKMHHPDEPKQIVDADGERSDLLKSNGWTEVQAEKKSEKD